MHPLGKNLHIIDRDIPFTPLDRSNISSVQANNGCEFLLREPEVNPSLPEVLSEDQSRRLGIPYPFVHGLRMLAVMTMPLQTISSIFEDEMDRERRSALIRQLIANLAEEAKVDHRSWEKTQAPICVLDQESYSLLVEKTGRTNYPAIFTNAIITMRTILTPEQLSQGIDAIKFKRSHGRHQTVQTKVGTAELEWIFEMATALKTRPARILESVIFLYMRTEL